MESSRQRLQQAAFWCAFGSALTTMFSISISQTLLGVGLLLLFVSGASLRFPPIELPLGLFFVGTLLSLAFSTNPAAGMPQIRKFFVFAVLLLIASTFRRIQQARWLVLGWLVAAVLSALRGFWQFYTKWEAAKATGVDFYSTYVSDRITGFMSHWMTFSGLQMVALLLTGALLLFGACRPRLRVAMGAACVLIAASIVLSLTRGMWLATAAASCYLLWNYKRWLVAALPVLGLLLFYAGPQVVRTRLNSFTHPQGDLDSNQHRVVTFKTGVAMIKAHPWLGLGPEMVGRDFQKYIPADVPRPLPRGWYGHLHNIYLQYAAERGIPTLLMLLWMIGACLYSWWTYARGLPPGHPSLWLLHGCIAVLLGTLVSGVVEHNLGDSEVLLMTLSVLTLGYVAREAVI